METTNLITLITKSNGEISDYLGDVPVDQFIKDVQGVIGISAHKIIIQEAIEKLQQIIKD